MSRAVSDLSVRIDLSAPVPVVSVVGDVDPHSLPTLAGMLANVVRAGNERAIVELSDTELMDNEALLAVAADGACQLVLRHAPAATEDQA